MRVLIDSHVLLWWAEGRPMPARATEIIEDPANDLLFSMAGAWELALKLDRLGLINRFEPLLHGAIRELGLEILAIQLSHIIYSVTLPWHHRDPFDRILIAQALLEGVPILTADHKIPQYPVQVLW
jgi:PIN domain nuclease of toxin-antitoxin system